MARGNGLIFGERFRKKYALSEEGEANVKRGTLWTVVTNLLVMAGVGILYALMRGYMATLVEGAPLPAALPALVAVAAFLVLSFLTHLNQYHYTYSVVYDEVGKVRTSLAEHLRRLPLSFFTHRDLAELTETMMSDVERLEHVWSHVLGYLYGGYISYAIIAVIVLVYDWRLAIACLWGVPVAFALLFGSRKVFAAHALRAKAAALDVADVVQETLEDMREIRATGREEAFLDEVRKAVDISERRQTEAELRIGIFVNAASVIMRLGMATTVLVGAWLILTGQVDFMTLFMFLLMVTRVYAPFDQSLALIAEVFVSDVSVQRLNEVLDAPVASGADAFAPEGHDVVFDHVCFAYDEAGETVLEDVSFTARQGEVTALVGPSGSGKTTCASLAARLWDHGPGSIRVGGVEVLGVDPETLLGSFSMVFQDVTLFDDTVMENIRLGRRGATDAEVLQAARDANCDEFVARLAEGYATPIGENGARLSGGERQRISIARALLKDAPIVLLDEATASLDVESESEVQTALSRLLEGKTVLVIAHRMRTVMGADRVVVLDGGRVCEQGTPQELMDADGAFARMVRLQSESAGWSL